MTSGTSPRTHLETGSSAPMPGVPEPDRTYLFAPVPGVPEPGSTCLVAGSYPPVPGLAAAATVAAVRRVWAAGGEVVVVSPRPSAAPFVMPVVGAPVGRELVKFSRRGSGRRRGGNASDRAACDEVVVCMERGWPLPPRPGNNRQHRAVRSLAAALSRFEGAELVVTGDLGVAHDVLAGLWPAVERVTASSEDAASALRVAGAPNVRVVVPATSPGLTIQAGVGEVAGVGGVAHVAGLAGLDGAVGPLEPAELLLVARGRRLLGRTARKLLGSRAPAVRAYLWRSGEALRPQALWVRVRGKMADRA
jgi:hypothetical protein